MQRLIQFYLDQEQASLSYTTKTSKVLSMLSVCTNADSIQSSERINLCLKKAVLKV